MDGPGPAGSLRRVVNFTVIPAKAESSTAAGPGSRAGGNDEKGRSEASTFNLTTRPKEVSWNQAALRTATLALARALRIHPVPCPRALFPRCKPGPLPPFSRRLQSLSRCPPVACRRCHHPVQTLQSAAKVPSLPPRNKESQESQEPRERQRRPLPVILLPVPSPQSAPARSRNELRQP